MTVGIRAKVTSVKEELDTMSGVTDDVAASEVNRGREVVAQDPAKRHRGKSKSKDDNATLEGRVTSLEQTLDYGSYKNFRLYVEPSIKIRLGHPKNEVGHWFGQDNEKWGERYRFRAVTFSSSRRLCVHYLRSGQRCMQA